MYSIRQIIETRKIQRERPKVKEVWCVDQVEDFERIIQMVEELIAVAVASNSCSHQYAILQETRKNFISDVLTMAEKYRIIDN
jgi:hypothetical protein